MWRSNIRLVAFCCCSEIHSHFHVFAFINKKHITLYVLMCISWGKCAVAVNRWTKLLDIPFVYIFSAISWLTKFFPVPVQPWRDRTRGFFGFSFFMKPVTAFRMTWAATCCPYSLVSRSYFSPEDGRTHLQQPYALYRTAALQINKYMHACIRQQSKFHRLMHVDWSNQTDSERNHGFVQTL